MTKKEQIYEIAKYVCNACEFGIYGPCSKRQPDVKSCDLALGTAKRIYKAGYRKVPDGAVVLTPEERDDEMKATNEILAERDDLIARVGNLGRENYDLKTENEQLKAKIERLKAEFKQLETNAEILARGIRDFNHENYELTEKIKQAKIDVLNEVNEKINVISRKFGDCGRAAMFKCSCAVDELIREVQNAENKSRN